MKKKDNNLFNILLEDENVNFYTKMLIMLSMLDYYEDYYIPNIKLMKMLGINKKSTIRLLKKLEDENIIRLFYKGKKRYFSFIKYKNKKKLNNDKIDLFDYDWLNEE